MSEIYPIPHLDPRDAAIDEGVSGQVGVELSEDLSHQGYERDDGRLRRLEGILAEGGILEIREKEIGSLKQEAKAQLGKALELIDELHDKQQMYREDIAHNARALAGVGEDDSATEDHITDAQVVIYTNNLTQTKRQLIEINKRLKEARDAKDRTQACLDGLDRREESLRKYRKTGRKTLERAQRVRSDLDDLESEDFTIPEDMGRAGQGEVYISDSDLRSFTPYVGPTRSVTVPLPPIREPQEPQEQKMHFEPAPLVIPRKNLFNR